MDANFIEGNLGQNTYTYIGARAPTHTHTHTHTHNMILTGFYFIIIIQHSTTCGRHILLWCYIMIQLRSSLPVITSWSHTVIDVAFVKLIWCMIKDIKVGGFNMKHSLLTSRNIQFFMWTIFKYNCKLNFIYTNVCTCF